MGPPEEDCDITPVISASSADFIEGLVMDAKEKGATFLTEYKRWVVWWWAVGVAEGGGVHVVGARGVGSRELQGLKVLGPCVAVLHDIILVVRFPAFAGEAVLLVTFVQVPSGG